MGFEALKGMPLTILDLSRCPKLVDSGLEHLRGLPLTRVILAECNALTAATLDILSWLPPSALYIEGCNWRPGVSVPTGGFSDDSNSFDVGLQLSVVLPTKFLCLPT